jgi:hypothetical protein
VFVPVVNILFYCFAIFLGDCKLEIVPGRGQKPVYKCSLTNDADGHATIENCELLIDSGNTACDLLCTWHDALKFNLRASTVKQTVTCANVGEEVIVQLVPQLLVQFSLEDNDHHVTVKSAHLDVWVMQDEIPISTVARPLWTPPSCQFIEKTQTPTAHCATTPAVNKACPEKKVSPVKHTSCGMANLGKSGCKKLCLKYDFEYDHIFFIKQNKEDYQEI